MSEIRSESTPSEPAHPAQEHPPVANVIATNVVFAAALERLNRESTLRLLQEIVHEVDEHCRQVPLRIGQISEQSHKLRDELLVLIADLRQHGDRHHGEITSIRAQITELHAQLVQIDASLNTSVTNVVNQHFELNMPVLVQHVTKSVTNHIDATVEQNLTLVSARLEQHLTQQITQNISATFEQHVTNTLQENVTNLIEQRITGTNIHVVHAQIEQLLVKLELLERAAHELDAGKLQQIESLLLRLLASGDLSAAVHRVNLTINGRAIALVALLEALATADKVQAVHLLYSGEHLSGARLVLIDNTEVVFVGERHEHAERGQIHYHFRTQSWKGLAAGFQLIFSRRRIPLKMCGREVFLDSYDGVYQSNIVFDLGPRRAG